MPTWEQKWEKVRRLGSGGQGETFEVISLTDRSLTGAMKCLRNNRSMQARKRMRREVVALETLTVSGVSVPEVLDENTESFETPTVPLYVVMELIEGKTLRDYVTACGPLTVNDSITAARSVLGTIRIGHASGILHRDLKPENVMVRGESLADLVVLDYGLSFNADEQDITETEESFRNRFLSLPENMSSELRRDERSDLTAICALLYFCLTGENVGQLLDGRSQLPHRRPGKRLDEHQSVDARLSQLERLLTKGFSWHLENRYQTAIELENDLESVAVASTSADSDDPILLSARLSEAMAVEDRTTQLESMKKAAERLVPTLMSQHQKYAGKLNNFTLDFSGGGFRAQNNVPAGTEKLSDHGMFYALSVEHHPWKLNRQYFFVAKGMETSLYATDFEVHLEGISRGGPTVIARRQPGPQFTQTENFIGTYREDPESITQLISDEFAKWLRNGMQELMRRVQAANTQKSV